MNHHRTWSAVVFLVLAMLVWTLSPVVAEEPDAHGGHSEAADSHGNGDHHFKNALALFLGATNEHGHGTEPTWGLEYARTIHPHWSVGGLIDYAGGAQRNLVIAPAVFWFPFGEGLVLMAAPGVEYHKGRGEVDHHLLQAAAAEVYEDQTYFVMRFGVAYIFHVGARYGIAPTVNLDLVEGHEVWVYGVNFEVMF